MESRPVRFEKLTEQRRIGEKEHVHVNRQLTHAAR